MQESIKLREVVLRIKHQNNWISEVTKDSPARVRILDCKLAQDNKGVHQIISIETPEEELLRFISKVKESKHIATADIVKTKRGRGLGGVLVRDCVLCAIALGSSVFCRTCLFNSKKNSDGTVDWTLALNGRESLQEFLERIRSLDTQVMILSLASLVEGAQLTPRQKEIMQTALERGFFDYPRKIHVKELSTLVKSSPSTLSEVLRRAHKTMVTEYFRPAVEK